MRIMKNHLRPLKVKWSIFGSAIILLIFITISETSRKYLNPFSHISNFSSDDRFNYEDIRKIDAKKGEAVKFWDEIFQLIWENRLRLSNYELRNAVSYTKTAGKKIKNTKEVLLSKAKISNKILKEFETRHKNLLEWLPSKLPTTTYHLGTNGIVFVGGGRYSWLSYLSLLGLRETGSILPVEFVLPTQDNFEEELEFCIEILPKLNASCVVIPETFGARAMHKWNNKIKSFQFKSLALLASSFQNVLLLDSDNIVIDNPDPFFESDLFKKYGMITWPDYSGRTISPHFYNISGAVVNERKRVRYMSLPINFIESDNNLLEAETNSVPFHDLEGAVLTHQRNRVNSL